MAENDNKKVSFQIFVWAIGIILIAFGFVFNIVASLSGKIENSSKDMVDIKMDVSIIKTDVSWIKETIKNTKLESAKIIK